jgi:Kef-type K+ transport system membrane component KefB
VATLATLTLYVSGLLVAVALARVKLPALVPDIILMIGIGLVVGASGLSGSNAVANPAIISMVWPLQFIGLFLLVFPSCATLHVAPGRSQLSQVAVLVLGSLISLSIAALSISILLSLAPDPDIENATAPRQQAHQLVMCLGVLVCSLPFLAKIFFNVGLAGSPFAQSSLVSATLVDVVVWVLFSLAIALHRGASADLGGIGSTLVWDVTVTGLLACVSYIIVTSTVGVVRPMGPTARLCVIVGFAMSVTAVAAVVGIGALIGMVIAGLAVSTQYAVYAHSISQLVNLSNRFGSPMYFISVGFFMNLRGGIDLLFVVSFLFWSSAIKVISVFAVYYFFRRDFWRSLDFGIVMNTRGGPGLVLAAAAYAEGIIGATGFITLTAASVLTAIMTEAHLRFAAPRILADRTVPVAPSKRFLR